MENKSERFKSSGNETESRREKFSRFKEEVDNCDKNASNGKKIIDTKESSCQTELDEILRRQMEEFEDELEQVRETMEKECAEEKEDFEMRVRNEYNEIIKAKEELIRVLTEEKDFFRNELCDLRRSFDLFTRHVHRDAFHHLGLRNENEIPVTTTKSTANGTASSCCDTFNIADNRELLTLLRKQEEILLGSFEREKAAMSERFQQEKASLRKVVEDECESKYSFERAYLLQSIEVLKEGLDSLRIQKHELAKIFEGEKNAMELSFKRKEDELRQQLKLELQRKMILAQKQWARTKI